MQDDLSIDALELLGTVATALIIVTQSTIRPSYPRDTMLMRGGNTSAV